MYINVNESVELRTFVRSYKHNATVFTLECTKLIKVGTFFELDSLDSYPVHFASLASLYIVRAYSLLALAHEMFN